MHDIHVFGDSHWRVFFPFVNHGSPGLVHEDGQLRVIDMVANELSGATMYGLLNDASKNGARRRILGDLDRLGGVQNVGLVFGEVDARYHNSKYYFGDKISRGRVVELLARFRRFVDEDLLFSGRVRGKVFIYNGFRYPQGENTLLQPGQPIGSEALKRAEDVANHIWCYLDHIVGSQQTHIISPYHLKEDDVSPDGVHLIPERIYPQVRDKICKILDWKPAELPL